MNTPDIPPQATRRATWERRLRDAAHRRRGTRGNRAPSWRGLVAVVFAVTGTLMVTSALSSDGIDLRAEGYGDLDSLARQQNRQVQAQQAEIAALTAEVEELTGAVDDTTLNDLERQREALADPAGMLPVAGPGVTVSLADAPPEVAASAEVPASDLVVHQQDIQAVVNALWVGGARAMTLQGQRVISTTGIKCVGNVVILHGVPYSPPYVISAVGNTDELLGSIAESDYIQEYLQYAEQYDLGFDLDIETQLELPGYEGVIELDYARPAGGAVVPEDPDGNL